MPSLGALHGAGHAIPLVVTQPDRPGHRMRPTPPPVKEAALGLGLEVFQPDRIRSPEAVARLASASPDVMVVVAYGQIIPPAVLEIPPLGVLNVHASLLPRHRGAAPVAHAILAGDATTGVTIMCMDEQLDHGPILAARETAVGAEEDAPALTARLAEMGAALLVDTLQRLGEIVPVEQDHGLATAAPKLSRMDGELDWSTSALEIDRRVRALAPWPGVTLPWRGGRIKVLRGRAVPDAGGTPGEPLPDAGPGLLVATGRGAYRLDAVQVPGRRPMSGRALAVRP